MRPDRTSVLRAAPAPPPALDVLASSTLSGALAGLALLGVELTTTREPEPRGAEFWGAAMLLFALSGAALGLTAGSAVALERWLNGRLPLAWQQAACVTFYGTSAALLGTSTAYFLFSGDHIRSTPAGRYGPLLLIGLLILTSSALAYVLLWCTRAQAAPLRRILVSTALIGAATSAALIDNTQYVGLYAKVHAALALLALGFWSSGAALLLSYARLRKPRAALLVRGTAVGLGLGLLAYVSAPGLRRTLAETLDPAWTELSYVQRLLEQSYAAEQFLQAPLRSSEPHERSLRELRKRQGPLSAELDPIWNRASDPVPATLAELYQRLARFNVIVFYVDTLRADVAQDARIMPELAALAAEALDFRKAYAAGSDTLRSLPVLLSGSYADELEPNATLVQLARSAGYHAELIAPTSAWEFLHKKQPSLSFSHLNLVADHAPERPVWGYGAESPSSAELVERGLDFVATRSDPTAPYLLWLFHFDQHNWWHWPEAELAQTAAELGLRESDSPLPMRYRAVAARIDRELGRFVRQLRARGELERCILLVLSDHGESLTRFVRHTTFLWERLLRVPLLLRVPGIPGRRVETPVSLVDVAPTLAPLFGPSSSVGPFHGQSLLGFSREPAEPRRLPILARASQRGELVRIGIVDATRRRKLVLPLAQGRIEFHDLSATPADTHNLARNQPQPARALLEALLSSPVFPRTADSFWYPVRAAPVSP